MTLGIVTACPEHAELLPAMWAMCFSLGLFASCTQLPRAMFAVAAFYLVAGVVLLRVATDTSSFTPWAMGITFGGGQWLTAVVLWTDRS